MLSPRQRLQGKNGGDWIGPFVVNPAETTTDLISLDIIMPKGLYYANDSGSLNNRTVTWEVQARLIDDDGVALGSWITLGTETHTANTYKYSVAAGRYEVQAIRTNAKDNSARAGNDLNWKIHTPDFGDVTLLAMKMRATDNLSQRSSRMLNCIVTRKLSIWDDQNGQT